MSTTNVTISLYDSFIEYLGGSMNMDSDTFKMGLLTASYTPSASHEIVDDLTPGSNEASGGNYARVTLSNVSWSQVSGMATWDFDDVVFSASGGSIVAKYFFIYDDSLTDDPLVCYGLLDSSGNNVTTTDGNDLTLNIDADGFFNLAISA